MVAPKDKHSGVLTARIYSYRLQGFRSAAQVPASYFERRKRVRVRVANIVATAPPISDAPGSRRHLVDVRREDSREGALLDPTLGGKWEKEHHRGSDGETWKELFTSYWCQINPYSTTFKRAASTISVVLHPLLCEVCSRRGPTKGSPFLLSPRGKLWFTSALFSTAISSLCNSTETAFDPSGVLAGLLVT